MTLSRRARHRVGIAAPLALIAVTVASLSGCAGAASTSTLNAKESPLYKILGPLGGLDDKDALREQEREVQKAAATCMTDKGFTYKPSDSAVTTISVEGPGSDKSEDWVSKNGYGFSSGLKDDKKDPNQEYVDSLSEAEQTAYYEALYGPNTTTGEGEVSTTDRPTEGCLNEAYGKVSKTAFWDDRKYKKLLDSASEIFDKVEKVPAVKAVATKWSECMAEAGYSDMKTKSDAINYVSEKMSTLYKVEGGSAKDAQPSEPAAADIKKFRELEITVALADYRCNKKTGYDNVQLKAQFELEERFVREHKAELDDLVDAYGNKK